MNKKAMFEKYVSDIKGSSSPEAMEVKKIMMRMIKSEYSWAKTHQNEKVCSKCGRLNSQAQT